MEIACHVGIATAAPAGAVAVLIRAAPAAAAASAAMVRRIRPGTTMEELPRLGRRRRGPHIVHQRPCRAVTGCGFVTDPRSENQGS